MELMNLSGQVKKLVVVVGESDKVYQRALFEAIVYAAKKYKIAGATVTRGMLSYGSESMTHSSKIFALSEDVPVIIIFVDIDERLRDFSQIINKLIDKSGAGGLMTIEDVEVLRYGDNHE
jgi:PII-like signaling protein